jgi:hypothetical protein
MLAGCGGGSASQENSGTSAVTFQVLWDRPAAFQPDSLTDCADVETVSAAVYGADGVVFGEGGPWSCATGSGVLPGLPANRYATIGVAGYSPDGTLLYYGQSETIYLTPGSVDGGVITAGAFVPELLSPADDAIVATNALELRWRRLPGASGYRVALATDDSFSAESIIQEIAITDGNITSARPDVTDLLESFPYYWRVRAVSGEDRLSTPSPTRQFSLDTVVITSITLVNHGAAVDTPITTTVTFRYASIDYAEEQLGTTIGQWSAGMDSTDYFSLQEIVLSWELLAQSDVVLEVGMTACTGWNGETISIAGPIANEFMISGEVCSESDWPAGVSSLITRQNELVALYQP